MIEIKSQSKSISELKKGDKFYIQDTEMIVDSHYLFQDHGTTKEMIIEVYNPKNEREYQVRYFDDQVETSMEIYELIGDFQYVKREVKFVSW